MGGCLYCHEKGSRASYLDTKLCVSDQLKRRIEYLKAKKLAKKFIAYFQAFSNTYAPLEILKKTYDQVLPFEEVVGLSIGTRPDTVDEEKLALISSYKNRFEVWIEYGLQSIHDRTLKAINRGHSYKDFLKAVEMTRRFEIPICAHVILGLPDETIDEMMATARELKRLDIDGIKIHLFHILKGSGFEKLYHEGKIRLLEQDEYVHLVCNFIENLSPRTIIQRLTGEGTKEDHIAPKWALDKIGTINKIEAELRKRGG